MSKWKLHIPGESKPILRYKCGLAAGQHVRLKKDLKIRDHKGKFIGKIHPAGEEWIVLPGITSDPVLWFRQPDGKRHTWSDDSESVEEWFEVLLPPDIE